MKSAGQSIAVVEPQMHNLFHSPFNAALLHAIVLAFPEKRVSFSALPGHASAVRGILEEHAPEILGRVEWRRIEPSRGESLVARWFGNRRTLRTALRARERVVFSSISRMQLMQLKGMMTPEDEVLAVLHGDLDRIAAPETDRFPISLFSLRRVLLKEQPRGLRFVLLGESIRRHIPAEFEAVFANAAVIDHPYHFPITRARRVAPDAEGVVFGIFGNCGDGRLLEGLARAVKEREPRILFRLIGFLGDDETVARLAPLVEGAGAEPIPREEFARRAESIDYALWLAPAGSFRMRASGTFFDALAYAKPLVYVANPYIDSCLSSAPELAYRCASTEEVAATILQIVSRFDEERYLERRRAMERFRLRFAPETLATTLASKFRW